MLLVLALWVLAMIAGLSWSRWWTSGFAMMALIGCVWSRAGALNQWMTWAQLITLGATPWLLAAQRRHDALSVKRLQVDEAGQLTQLSELARALLSLQNANQQLEAQIGEMTDVYHVTKETSRALHRGELFAASVAIASRLLPLQGLRLIDLSESVPQMHRAARTVDGRFTVAHGTTMLPLEETILQQVRTSGRAMSAIRQQLSCSLPDEIDCVAWAPLWREQKPIGVLVADNVPEPQVKMLSMIAHQLSLQLSRVRLYEQVEALAVTDGLTGLFVRNYFLGRAKEELARCARHQLSCTLLMADLDLFKQKNDTYGHLVGDVVLKDVARLLQRNLRDIDLIARFGGEEFILLLVETNIEQAMPIAQRLKQLVEVHPIHAYDELLTQTISVGVAGFPDHAQTLDELIERADQALYAAKRAGRNRVVRWSEMLKAA